MTACPATPRRRRVGPFALCAWACVAAAAAAADTATGPRFGFAGEQRARYESLAQQFRPLLDERDEVLALRTTLTFAADWPRWQLAAEIMDARTELNDAGSVLNTGIVNTLEPLELAMTRRWQHAGGGASRLRAGRLTVNLGKRRLIARNAYRNTRTSFVGADWEWLGPRGQSARVLYLEPMVALPLRREALLDNDQHLDEPAGDTALVGLFYRLPELRRGHRFEVYAIDLNASEPVDRRDLVTAGARVWRPAAPGAWHYEVELIAQTGESTALAGGVLRRDLDHRAHFAHVELGYAFDARWSPVVTFQYDRATGDEDPDDDRNQRFDTLYGARRFDFGPTGIYGPFARGNLETPGIRVTVEPAPRWRAMVAYGAFELESPRDAWTTTLARDPTGESGASLGRQVEGAVTWNAIDERLGIELGFAHFSKGRFVERVLPDRSRESNYYYVQTTVSF